MSGVDKSAVRVYLCEVGDIAELGCVMSSVGKKKELIEGPSGDVKRNYGWKDDGKG